MRTSRSARWKTCPLGFAAAAALLTTTACQSDDGPGDAKKPTPAATTASATPSTAAPSSAPPTTAPPTAPATTTAPEPGKDKGTGTGDGGTSTATACTDNDLSIATSAWRMDSGQHLLITATNFTDTPCTLYHYPRIGFGATIDGPIPAMGSKPKAIVTIGPKQKAYAGLFLFRGGQRTVAVEAVSIGYQDRAPGSNADVAMLDVPFPKEMGSGNVGPDPRSTYWHRDQRTVEDILFRSGAGGS
ncbi:DUF4232 domain-containing protein [Streptomyces sp. NPDC014870]|uniref:DUF4232 domain-containing protein n=1 Tax=Streptomyces sp. NPDC014870 TaxID=3364925 RepID=UPI0036F6D78C